MGRNSLEKSLKIKDITEAFGKHIYAVKSYPENKEYAGTLTLITKDQCSEDIVRIRVGTQDIFVKIYEMDESGQREENSLSYETVRIKTNFSLA